MIARLAAKRVARMAEQFPVVLILGPRQFKCGAAVARHDATGLRAGIADGVISRGVVVYAGMRRYPLDERIEALPASLLRPEPG